MIFDLEYMERYQMTAEDYQKEPWQKVWLSHLKWKYEAERREWDNQQRGYGKSTP